MKIVLKIHFVMFWIRWNPLPEFGFLFSPRKDDKNKIEHGSLNTGCTGYQYQLCRICYRYYYEILLTNVRLF